jgi:hypothetical protein
MVYRSAFAQIFPRSQPMTESKTSIPSILTSAVTASCHFFFDLLLFHFPPSPSTNNILACLCSTFLPTYPSHLCAFMCFVLLYTAYISLFVFRLHLPSSVRPLKYFLSIFLSHPSSFISFFSLKTQVLHPYRVRPV